MIKILLLAVLMLNMNLSFGAEPSKSLWPRLSVWSTGVDLRIDNYTEDDYSCSGMIYITHESGKQSNEYYFGRVYSRGHEYRYFMNRYYNDRIRNAHHSIYCYRL